MNDRLVILQGDCVERLRDLPDGSVQCCVSSPPYWGLRDYLDKRQIGHEKTPELYVARLVECFQEVKRVLKDDGTLWLNLGDCYAGGGNGGGGSFAGMRDWDNKNVPSRNGVMRTPRNYKPKDLIGIPWMTAFALRANGWYLRMDNIWHKPNPMPESVTDRCTRAHEYMFHLSKSAKYYCDMEAIAEPLTYGSAARLSQDVENQNGSDRIAGKTNGNMKAVYKKPYVNGSEKAFDGNGVQNAGDTKSRIVDRILSGEIVTRNKRSVWTIPTACYSGAHFATYPTALVKPCILAGSRVGDTVLDPFGGSGTTAAVALELGRKAVTIELNPDYVNLIKHRTNTTPGLPL